MSSRIFHRKQASGPVDSYAKRAINPPLSSGHISRFFLAPALLLAVSFAANADSYQEAVDKFPPLESDMGRIFFFGSNNAFLESRATLSINGEELDGPYGQNIFFFVDRLAGEYVIAVDGEVELQFDLGRGEKKYVSMARGRPVNPKPGFFQPESLPWVINLRLMSARHAEAVMRNMRWKE